MSVMCGNSILKIAVHFSGSLCSGFGFFRHLRRFSWLLSKTSIGPADFKAHVVDFVGDLRKPARHRKPAGSVYIDIEAAYADDRGAP